LSRAILDASALLTLLLGEEGAGLSFGDRACLALAISRGEPALTADRAWLDADVGAELAIIR
jgi:PIN domain nuclease of toxin-antitoxin system